MCEILFGLCAVPSLDCKFAALKQRIGTPTGEKEQFHLKFDRQKVPGLVFFPSVFSILDLERLCVSAFLSYILSIRRLLGRHGLVSAGSSAARLGFVLALISARSSVGHLRPRKTC